MNKLKKTTLNEYKLNQEIIAEAIRIIRSNPKNNDVLREQLGIIEKTVESK